jgi:hypothetical protein
MQRIVCENRRLTHLVIVTESGTEFHELNDKGRLLKHPAITPRGKRLDTEASQRNGPQTSTSVMQSTVQGIGEQSMHSIADFEPAFMDVALQPPDSFFSSFLHNPEMDLGMSFDTWW